MLIQEYVIRLRDGLWEIRLGDQLLSGQPTQMDALHVAEALAHASSFGAFCATRVVLLRFTQRIHGGDKPVDGVDSVQVENAKIFVNLS